MAAPSWSRSAIRLLSMTSHWPSHLGRKLAQAGSEITLPRPLPFLDPQRPPVEARGRADEVGAALQGEAALGLGILQLLDAGKVPIGQHRVRQRPQMFGWL